jgi:hypothetical protein
MKIEKKKIRILLYSWLSNGISIFFNLANFRNLATKKKGLANPTKGLIAGSHGPQGQGPPSFRLFTVAAFFVKATNSQNANFLI